MSLTNTLTNTSEHTNCTRTFGNVINNFHSKHRFTHTSTTNNTNFTTLHKRCEKVEHLQPCFEHFIFRIHQPCFLKGRRENWAFNHFIKHCLVELWLTVDGACHRIPHTTNHFFTNRNFKAAPAARYCIAFLNTIITTNIQTKCRITACKATYKQWRPFFVVDIQHFIEGRYIFLELHLNDEPFEGANNAFFVDSLCMVVHYSVSPARIFLRPAKDSLSLVSTWFRLERLYSVRSSAACSTERSFAADIALKRLATCAKRLS